MTYHYTLGQLVHVHLPGDKPPRSCPTFDTVHGANKLRGTLHEGDKRLCIVRWPTYTSFGMLHLVNPPKVLTEEEVAIYLLEEDMERARPADPVERALQKSRDFAAAYGVGGDKMLKP